MRTIKLTHEQFRIWRKNAPAASENELSDREKMKKELLERNSGQTFRLRSPMGPFIGTVRGENNSSSSIPMAANGAPSPDACLCKQFAGTVPGAHHPICQHRAAWEMGNKAVVQTSLSAPNLNPAMTVTTQKVMAPIDTTPRVQHMQVPKQVPMHQQPIRTSDAPVASQALPTVSASPVAVVQVPAVIALIPPDQCDCRHFAKPSDADHAQHHFVCQHFEKWRIAHPTPKPDAEASVVQRDTEKPPAEEGEHVLVDLDTQSVLREATSEEVDRAREEENKNGSPIITLDEGVYAVVQRPVTQESNAP